MTAADGGRTVTWLEATVGDPALGELWDFLADQVALLADGRVRTRIRHVGVDAGGIRTPANRLLSDAAILATALDVQEQSDAIVIGCWGAPTEPVRAASTVPVTSLPDGASRAVGSLARRAVVVTVSPALVPIFRDDLTRLGPAGFLAERPVRSYDPESSHADVVRAIHDPEPLIERFDEVARAAVEDGADAVVVGCGYLAPLFTHHGYTSVGGHPDVPVLDCNRLAFSHALQLLDLAAAGIGPTARGYVRPSGARGVALAAAAMRMSSTADEPSPRP
ncbi:aspartate/glutamate racemase family protein [Microbacterium marinilacus]|uniref:Hydantoin racemase n=1 Tax=Microbacterium marinilacus TaxID=415209 RepID=A0ABP7B584_9MICO|nr:aspartate/glutamate racemase family protein [Microbacterium marinilacus]MBY0689973.1 aspartate/glutamate racemase family protein [Microbacterium marinilacus]